jgi:hypothetical protein
MKTAARLSLKWWLLARETSPSLSTACQLLGFLIRPKQSAISIRLSISFRKSAVETLLGKLGNNGLGCTGNPVKKYNLYFKQFRIIFLSSCHRKFLCKISEDFYE